MILEIFTLCEFAEQPKVGNLNIRNTLDTLTVDQVPFRLDLLHVAMRIRFPNEEAGTHLLKLNIFDPDSNVVISAPGQSPVIVPSYEHSGTLNLVFRFEDVPFTTFGRHSVVLTIDGDDLGELPLHVRKAPNP